jgi:hypothetical protein
MVSDPADDGPISPELVLIDPALRAQLAMREPVLPKTVEPLDADANAVASTEVPVDPIVLGHDESPVRPEPVLVDPAVRSGLAVRESVLPETAERPHTETGALASTDILDVPIVSGDEGRPHSAEPVLVDPVLRAHLAVHVPRRSGARRLLVVVAGAVALAAAASFGVFVGLLLSGDRVAVLGDALVAPPPPVPTKAATATAATPANPAVSTQPPITRARTAVAAALQTGVGSAPSSHLLVWAPVANATGYTVEITRNGVSVYSAATSTPNVRVRDPWRYHGRTMTLSPGTYRWYVWPIVRSGSATRKRPAAVVASKLEISP